MQIKINFSDKFSGHFAILQSLVYIIKKDIL